MPALKQARRQRTITPILRDMAPLIMLGSALFYTNDLLTITQTEAASITDAARNITTILTSFRSAQLPADVSASYTLLFHFWVQISGGLFGGLRAPSIISYVIGLWILSRVARRLAGDESSDALVWLGALWPFGFHYGRTAGPYPFAFLLIALLTWQYFRCIASDRFRDWILFCVLSLLLLYTTDFAWALIFFLAVDYWRRIPKLESNETESRGRVPAGKIVLLTATIAVLAIGFAPRWPAFGHDLGSLAWPHSLRFLAINAAYYFYMLFVGPSMAPFYWRYSIPAAIGIIVFLAFVIAGVRSKDRRFLFFSLLLFALMALTGILRSERLLLIAPWFFLPMATALGTIEKWQWRIPMALAMTVVAAVGWYGVLNRRYYVQPAFLEPWNSTAEEAAVTLRGGGGVISNDQAFFLYLTYSLKPAPSSSSWRFRGALPVEVTYPSVWNPSQWESKGRPKPDQVFWIRGYSTPQDVNAMDDAGQWLNEHCGDRTTQFLARDPTYSWKQRFVPHFSGPPWLIEIRQYSCGAVIPGAGPAAGEKSSPNTSPAPQK
jgi:hypothetical protein